MPYKSGNKWKWGNLERSSKEDLRKVVYGIWLKNGGKGSFSKFWSTGKVNEVELLSEGKHWPEDYEKTAINLIKSSAIGKQPWYTNQFISQDVKTFVDEFAPLSHKNSNLGFFMAIIRWFVEYSGDSKQKYQEFIERKLDGIIATLLKIRNDKGYDARADEIKKMSFSQFEKLMDKVNAKISDEKIQTAKSNKTYKVIPIYSYEELHEKYGGNLTGYKGESEWCHTNGKSTYDSWTKGGTQMFFVIEQDGWKKIKSPDPKALDSAYDEYGMSLIAILVDVASTKLLKSTLRQNHVILPKSGAADTAFESWEQLDDAVGVDVKKICEDEMKSLKQKLQAKNDEANAKAAEILKSVEMIDDHTIPDIIKKHLTKVDIPKNVTSIGWYAFFECDNLMSVTIPASVTSIGEGAFCNCHRLTSVTIPNSVTSIGNLAFWNCSGLTRMMIPNSVVSIGQHAFRECNGLTSVTIPKGVTDIGSFAFSWCSSLTSITIPSSVMSIGNEAFRNCSSLTSVTISNGVTSIGDYAFFGCTGLTSVTIPGSVTSIGDYAFIGCSSLTSVTIPDSMTSIGDDAFSECTNLTSVMIPNSVTSIGDWVFNNCSSLKSLIFKGKTLDEVKKMKYYPWGIEDESIIKVEKDEMNESFTIIQQLCESCVIASGHRPHELSMHDGIECYTEALPGNFAYDVVKKCIGNCNCTKDDIIQLDAVWSIDNGKYYIAQTYGKNDRPLSRRKWISYLQEVEQFISCMLENGCGDVWLLDFENDSFSDAWTLCIGFTLLSSPFKDDN